MKNLKNIIVCLLFITGTLFGQKRLEDSKLLFTINQSVEDIAEMVDNNTVGLKYEMNFDRDLIAIRICSILPLPVAINTERGAINSAEKLVSVGIPIKNIFFLRQADSCLNNNRNAYSTQFWLIRDTGELPDFIELRKAENPLSKYLVREDFLYYDSDFNSRPREKLSDLRYSSLIESIANLLKNNKSTLIIVEYTNTNPLLKRNLKKLKEILFNTKISKSRIFIQRTQGLDSNQFPNITFVDEM